MRAADEARSNGAGHRAEPRPGPDTPDHHLVYVLAKVSHRLTLVIDQALQNTGITLTQFSALAHIHARPGISGAELARRLLTTPQATGTLIARLTAAGLAEREIHGRGHPGALRLTDAGTARVRAAEVVATRAERESLEVLTASEQEDLLGRLNRLLDSLG